MKFFTQRSIICLFRNSLLALFFISFSFSGFGQTSISGVVNSYASVTSMSAGNCDPCDANCTDTITVSDSASFFADDKALIIQMKGADLDITNSSSGGSITAINQAGNYEFFEIESVSGTTITLKYPLVRSYNFSGKVQIVKIPNYNEVNITGTLTAPNWDTTTGTGGVVVLSADEITFNANIDVRGKGFKGLRMTVNGTPDNCTLNPLTQFILPSTNNSSYIRGEGIAVSVSTTNRGRAPRANGGGSGVSGDSGGGGGSNFGAGGEGGKRWCNVNGDNAGGIGGLSMTPYLSQDKAFLGGAGGPGFITTSNFSSAANGGGIVILFAETIIGNGYGIEADGLSPTAVMPNGPADGGSGGGGGGTVILKAENFTSNLTVNINGGDGEDLITNVQHGPGGGGGGGVLLFSKAALPANVIVNSTGGDGGVHNDGARNGSQNGQAGGEISLFIPIENPNYNGDPDNDGVSEDCDLDDDNDGILDTDEYDASLSDPFGDSTGNGTPNYFDPSTPSFIDANNDGIDDRYDTDLDGVLNQFDTDSDNDGCPDALEGDGGFSLTDINSSGQINSSVDAVGVPTSTGTGTSPQIDSDGSATNDSVYSDLCDNDDDGNPNGTDPFPNSPTAQDDYGTATLGVATAINILDNDDFLTNLEANNIGTTAILDTGTGTATGIIQFDENTGNLIYTSGALETIGDIVTVIYNVCNTDPNPDVCATATVNITIVGTNQAPVAITDNYSIDEDTTVQLLPLAGDSDPDGDDINIDSINGVALTPGIAQQIAVPNGLVDIDNLGVIIFTPAADYNGQVTFPYVISDVNGVTATANQIIDVAPVADIVADTDTTPEDTAVTTVVLDNDTFTGIYGTDYTVTSTTISANGTTTIEADGTITYTPDADFNGTDTFDYTVTVTNSDGSTTTETATVTVTVNPIDDANDDIATTDEDTAVTIDVIDNDGFQGVYGTDYEVTDATAPANGTLVINPDGTITYTPDADFNGTDTFDYTVTVTNSDGSTTTETATVTIMVTPVNDAPVAVDDNYTVSEESTVILTPLDLDSDIDGDILSIVSINGTLLTPGTVQVITTPNGTVNIDAAGVITFTPSDNYNGTETFGYVITDGTATATANQIIEVTAVNDAPVAVDDSYSVAEEGTVTLTPLDLDSD
ncbi:tandem-95 repeat protein, partial [Bizionia saleffrena]